jgi:hypothetical protein
MGVGLAAAGAAPSIPSQGRRGEHDDNGAAPGQPSYSMISSPAL